MRPHRFQEPPRDWALMGRYLRYCGHVDLEAQLLCLREREHPDHIEKEPDDASAA